MSTMTDYIDVEESFVPSITAVASITAVLYSHLLTLSDEIEYIWQRPPLRLGKILYLWIRYYTIALVVFDVVQAHWIIRQPSISRKTCFITTCVARIGGAINLWSVQLLMQLRIYALHGNSKPVGACNLGLYLLSIVGFSLLLSGYIRTQERSSSVAMSEGYGWTSESATCSLSRAHYEWAQWLPATAFEVWLFGWAVVKSHLLRAQYGTYGHGGPAVMNIVLRGNILWFVGVTSLLIVNTLTCSRSNSLPWIGYGPFHAGTSMLTSQAMLDMLKSIRGQNSLSRDDGSGTRCLPLRSQSILEFTNDVEGALSRLQISDPLGFRTLDSSVGEPSDPFSD